MVNKPDESTLIERRQQARERLVVADALIAEVAARMNPLAPKTPPLEPTPAQLERDADQAITLNVEWVAAALSYQLAAGQIIGRRGLQDMLQPLLDYANARGPQPFDDSVADNGLRDILIALVGSA